MMGLTFMLIIVPWTGVPVGIQFAVRFFLLQFKIYFALAFLPFTKGSPRSESRAKRNRLS